MDLENIRYLKHTLHFDFFVLLCCVKNIPELKNIRSFENRNLPGGDINDMFIFNEIIGHLGLLELPLKGRKFTWSNMQGTPLLEQLDWVFTSASWINLYPMTQ